MNQKKEPNKIFMCKELATKVIIVEQQECIKLEQD